MKLFLYVLLVFIFSCGKDSVQPLIESGNEQTAKEPTTTESTNESDELVLNDTIVMAYQKIYTNSENKITFSFAKVEAESRCPQGVQCFWEGDAEIKMLFKINDIYHEFSLHTFDGNQNSYSIEDYTFELITVTPYPVINQTFPLNKYKATVLISK